MSALLLRTSFGAIHTWTRLYTAGARPAPRDARRGQIASDLWEHEADALAEATTPRALAGEVASRVLRGVPADLAWRLRTGGIEIRSTFVIERSSGLVMVLVVLLIAGGFTGPGAGGDEPYFTYDFQTLRGTSMAPIAQRRSSSPLAPRRLPPPACCTSPSDLTRGWPRRSEGSRSS